jgi:hypothetical protein
LLSQCLINGDPGFLPRMYIKRLGLRSASKTGAYAYWRFLTSTEFQNEDWYMLAARLAEAHVPGLREEKAPRGAPTKWGTVERAELRIAIDDHIKAAQPRHVSVSSAATSIARHPPWSDKLARLKDPAATLCKQYEQADLRWVRIVRNARAWNLHQEFPALSLSKIGQLAGLTKRRK